MSHKKGVSLLSIFALFGLIIGSALFGVAPVHAADGSGTNTVSPTSTNVGSTGNEFTFTFTAAETMNSGGIAIEIPSGFSAPQGTAGTAGYTTVSTAGTIADVLDNADSVTGWSAGTQCNGGLTTDTTNKQEGVASIACTSNNVHSGNVFYKNITSQDWSGYTKVGFWIRSGKSLAAGNLQFSYDDSSNLDSPIENIAVPAIPFNSPWTYVVLDLGATTRSSVVSFGFRNNTGAGPLDFTTFRIDDLLIGPGSLSFPGGGVVGARLLQLATTTTVAISHGSGGGISGAVAPSTVGVYTATTTSRFDDSGTLTAIASHPTITVKNPVPVLTSISPTSTDVGSGDTVIALTGSDFISTSVARWNGSDRSTAFINTTLLNMTALASDLTTAGTSTITVFNPTPEGGLSDSRPFVVLNKVPVISSISPTSTAAGSATTTLTINGSFFASGVSVLFDNQELSLSSTGATQLVASIPAAYLTTPGTSTIAVVNPAPGGGTATTTFIRRDDAVALVIDLAEYNGTVDTPITVTITAERSSGEVDDGFGGSVTLVLESPATFSPAQQQVITFTAGIGTYDVINTLPEIVALSLLDSASTSLNVSSTSTVIFAPGAVTQFSLTHSGDMEQNTRKEFVAGRKDQYGNFVIASTTLAYLYASPTSTTKFYDAASGGNEITSIAFTLGNATTSFWFYSNAPATTTVTVSDNTTTPDGDTGINDASNEILVTPTAVRFEIVDPTDGTVDAAITVTVRALDEFGQVVQGFTENVTLLVTGSAVANPVLVDLESGVGTTQVSNTVAETVTLSLSDTQSTGLVATSTQDVVFGVGAFAKLNLNNVVNATAGELTAYTVTRTDQYNNQITSGSITVALSATPTSTPGVFYASNSTSSAQITSIVINSGSVSAQFWYYNEAAGSYQVTAQSGAVIGYDDIVIDPAAIAKFTMNDRTSMNPGSRVQYTVVRKDAFNNLVTTSATTAYLYADPAGVGTAFYDAATNGNTITSIIIASGQSSQDMWYYEETDGTHTITASDNATAPDGTVGILDATDSILVQTATGTQFVFNPDPSPLTVAAGNSSLVTIQVQDDFGNVDTNYQNDITLVTGVTSVSGSGLTNGQALIDIVNGEGTITLTNTVAETVNLALSDSQGTGLTVSDTASITWTPGAVAQFTITDQTSMVAGTSTAYVVTRKDQYGNVVTSGSNLVYLYTNSTGANARFQATETGTSSISFVTIANGFASTTFWYYDEDAGTWDVTASDNATAPDGATGIADASDSLIVTPAPVVADRYVILDPADAGLNEVTVIIIQTQDADGALDTTIQEDIYLVFSTSSVNVTGKVNNRVLVDIVDGVGTVQVHDAVAETVQLSLARIEGSTSTLLIASAQDVMFFVRQQQAAGSTSGAVSIPTVSFTGRAYPGAEIVLFARVGGHDIPLERDIEVRDDGTFTIDFSGALRGLESFGLAILDKNGKVAQVKTYTMDKLTRATEEKNLYIAPTADLIQRIVTIGNNVGIAGSAAPGSVMRAEVDGQLVSVQTQAGSNGTYQLLVNTREFDYGGHIIRVKQVDRNGVESDWSPSKAFTVTRALVTRADLNNNGVIDIGDWSIFLTRFASTNEEERKQVDLNNDGKVDISDFSIFIRSVVYR